MTSIIKRIMSGKVIDTLSIPKWDIFREIYDVSCASFLFTFANLAVRQALIFIGFYYISAEDYVLLSITFLFYLNMYQAQTIFLSMVGPTAAQKRELVKVSMMHQELKKFTIATGKMCILISIALVLFVYPLLRFFYLVEQIQAVSILILLLVGNILFFLTRDLFVYRSALNYLSEHWLVAKTEFIISTIAVLCVSYLLLSTRANFLVYACLHAYSTYPSSVFQI